MNRSELLRQRALGSYVGAKHSLNQDRLKSGFEAEQREKLSKKELRSLRRRQTKGL